jgi:hypothetical protein
VAIGFNDVDWSVAVVSPKGGQSSIRNMCFKNCKESRMIFTNNFSQMSSRIVIVSPSDVPGEDINVIKSFHNQTNGEKDMGERQG